MSIIVSNNPSIGVNYSFYNAHSTSFVVFNNIQDAINFHLQNNLSLIEINVAAGSYPDPITIPPNCTTIIKGPISGACLLGPVTYEATGNFIPFSTPGTACSFNDVGINGDITIVDYNGIAAINSVLITQNCTLLGSIVQTGKSHVTVLNAGIGTANAQISGVVESSQVFGNVNIPCCSLSATNTVFDGYVTAQQLYGSGSEFNKYITTTGYDGYSQVELHNCQIVGNITAAKILLDTFSYYSALSNNVVLSANTDILTTPKSVTINLVSGLTTTLTALQYFATNIYFTGTLVSGSTTTVNFPTGFWMLSTQDLIIQGNGAHTAKLVIQNGANTAIITSAGLQFVSITNTIGVK